MQLIRSFPPDNRAAAQEPSHVPNKSCKMVHVIFLAPLLPVLVPRERIRISGPVAAASLDRKDPHGKCILDHDVNRV